MASVTWKGGGDAFLRRHHADMTPAQMARAIGKDTFAVRNRMAALKLSEMRSPRSVAHYAKPWMNGEVARLRELRAQGLTIMQIASALGRTYPSVKAKLGKLKREAEEAGDGEG